MPTDSGTGSQHDGVQKASHMTRDSCQLVVAHVILPTQKSGHGQVVVMVFHVKCMALFCQCHNRIVFCSWSDQNVFGDDSYERVITMCEAHQSVCFFKFGQNSNKAGIVGNLKLFPFLPSQNYPHINSGCLYRLKYNTKIILMSFFLKIYKYKSVGLIAQTGSVCVQINAKNATLFSHCRALDMYKCILQFLTPTNSQ